MEVDIISTRDRALCMRDILRFNIVTFTFLITVIMHENELSITTDVENHPGINQD